MRDQIKKLCENLRLPGSDLRLRVLPLVVLGLAIAATIYLYAETLYDFFYYDDIDFLFRAKQISLRSLGPLFRPESYWRPIVILHFGAAFPFFQLNPPPYHLCSVLLHLANVVLLYLLSLRLLSTPMRAALAAALFAVSSKFTNAVHWISSIGDLYSVFFGLITILFFLEYLRRENRVLLACSLLFFSFALLSKESMVGLPALLWVSEIYIHEKSTRLRDIASIKGRWKKYLPFLFLWIVYLAVIIPPRFGANLYIVRGEYFFPPDFYTAYFIAGEALFNVHRWDIFVLILLVFVFYISLKVPLRGSKYGLLWFLIAIVPLLPFHSDFMNERFFYMPMVGVYVLAVALFGALFDWLRKTRWPKLRFVTVILAATIIVTSSLSVGRDIARFKGRCADFRRELERIENEFDEADYPSRFGEEIDKSIPYRAYIFLRRGIRIPRTE